MNEPAQIVPIAVGATSFTAVCEVCLGIDTAVGLSASTFAGRLDPDLEVPIIALSQLSRAVEQRHDKRPILSDLRESGSIEQDADLVMFVYRDEYYNPEDTESAGIAEVLLAKHRNGATGTEKLAFQKRYAKFADLAAA